jgi:hypothetical protein
MVLVLLPPQKFVGQTTCVDLLCDRGFRRIKPLGVSSDIFTPTFPCICTITNGKPQATFFNSAMLR